MIALSAYFARHLFEWVSLDATTWRLAATHNAYMNPLDLSKINIRTHSSVVENLTMMCQCPFCSNTSFQLIKDLPYTDRATLLRSHNFYVTKEQAQALHANAIDPVTFETFLNTRTQKTKLIRDILDCISLIDMFKNGASKPPRMVSGIAAQRLCLIALLSFNYRLTKIHKKGVGRIA
jgi:hypothetical protein